MKAIIISPDVIAQTMIGTDRMRASVIRLGMLLKDGPGKGARPELPGVRNQYNDDQAIACNAIAAQRPPRKAQTRARQGDAARPGCRHPLGIDAEA